MASTSKLQSAASSRAKIGGAYFSDVTGSIQDPIAVPGPREVTEIDMLMAVFTTSYFLLPHTVTMPPRNKLLHFWHD